VSTLPAYERRIVDDELDELVNDLPAIALEGPKGVGKTRTALQRAKRKAACRRRTQLAYDQPRELPHRGERRAVRDEDAADLACASPGLLAA